MIQSLLLSSLLLSPAAQGAPPSPAAAPAPPAEATPGPPAPDSLITRVVVFPKHAEITREVEVQAVAGENVARFSGLVPGLNPNTLRASVPDGARITGTELRKVYLEESLSEEIAALDASIQALEDELALQARAEARLAEEAAFYRAIKGRLAADMDRELLGGAVAVGDWKQVLAFVGEGLQACDAQAAELALGVRDRQERLALLAKQRADYSSRQPKEMREVAVSFQTDAPGPRRVAVHYIVDTVAWSPSYDVHLDRAAGEIEITGYGQIVQWSGEHWRDVELELAMSRPDFELTLPELTPMLASLDDQQMAQFAKEVAFLGSSAPDQAKKWSDGRFKRSQEREMFRRNLEQLARGSAAHLEHFGLSHALVEGALSRLVDRFAGVRYVLGRRETIPFDSSPHKVVAFSARVPAKLRYVATPALGSSVMLEGEILNTTGYPVLAGGASLFIDDSYVGAGSVTSAARHEPLRFGFGPDDSLVVERRLVGREVKGPEAFRQSQVITYRCEVTVQNFNQRATEVEVTDQIPVSKTPEIQVSFLDSSLAPQVDKASGTLRWTLEVGSGATSTIAYAFSVESPVGREVHWL